MNLYTWQGSGRPNRPWIARVDIHRPRVGLSIVVALLLACLVLSALPRHALAQDSAGIAETTGVTVAPNGIVWLLERNGMGLLRFDPATEQFQRFPIPYGKLRYLDAAQNNQLWFTVEGRDELMLYWVNGGGLSAYPADGRTPYDVAVATTNRFPWVSVQDRAEIGRYLFGTLSIWSWYPVDTGENPPPSPTAVDLKRMVYVQSAEGEDLWFVDAGSGKIGRLRVGDSTITVKWWDLDPGSKPYGIAISAGGVVWVTDPANRRLYRLEGDTLSSTELAGAPLNVAAESDVRAWVTMPDGDVVAAVDFTDPDAVVVDTTAPMAGSSPYDIAFHDGKVWFTQRTAHGLGVVDGATGVVQEYPLPASYTLFAPLANRGE